MAGFFQPFDNITFGTKNLNRYVCKEHISFDRDMTRSFMLGLTWDIRFGRKLNGMRKKANNQDSDSGIMNSKRF